MANTLTARKANFSRRRKANRLTMQLSGNYSQNTAGTATGEVMDLTNILNPGTEPNVAFGPTPCPVGDWEITKYPAGYLCEVISTGVANATLQNAFALKIYSAPGVELAAGAYPAALVGAQVQLQAYTSVWGQG